MEKLISLEPAALNQMAEWGKTNNDITPKIEAAIEYVENGGELVKIDLDKYNAMVENI